VHDVTFPPLEYLPFGHFKHPVSYEMAPLVMKVNYPAGQLISLQVDLRVAPIWSD
jgi:hypothetical protein